MDIRSGRVRILGKIYACTVINGERFIDGKTVEKFMQTLPLETVAQFAVLGCIALSDEKQGRKRKNGAYQKFIDQK